MLQQKAEEAKDMYDKQVFMGFEKPVDNDKNALKKPSKPNEKVEKKSTTKCDPFIQKIQERSLPVAPDYAQSFKPDDQDILYARSKEGQKLRDFGYELISGEDSSGIDYRNKDNRQRLNERIWNGRRCDKITPIKTKSFNWAITSEADKKRSEFNYKIDSDPNLLKYNSLDKQLNKNLANKVTSKSSKTFAGTVKKPSNTNYLSKITNRNKREKSLLGSPKLHRAIFGKSSESPSIFSSAKLDDPFSFNSKVSDALIFWSLSNSNSISLKFQNSKKEQTSSENLLHSTGTDYYSSHMDITAEEADVFETDSFKEHEGIWTMVKRWFKFWRKMMK